MSHTSGAATFYAVLTSSGNTFTTGSVSVNATTPTTPNLTIGSNVSFGTSNLYTGVSYNASFSVRNTGSGAWNGSMYVTLSNGQTLNAGPRTISAGSTENYSVSYVPTVSGTGNSISAIAKYQTGGTGSGIDIPNQSILYINVQGDLSVNGNAVTPSTGTQNNTNFTFSASLNNVAPSPTLAPTVDVEFRRPDGSVTTETNIPFTGSRYSLTKTMQSAGSYQYRYIAYQSTRPNAASGWFSFTVSPPAQPTISVNTPVSGSWGFGQQQTISWNATNGGCGPYTVEVSTNGGSSYSALAYNVTGTSYSWSIGKDYLNNPIVGIYSGNLRLKVYCRDTPTVNNVSGTFALAIPTLTVTTPSGWQISQNQTINWNLANAVCTQYTVELSTSNGNAPLHYIRRFYSGGNSLSWTIPKDENNADIPNVSNNANLCLKVYCSGYTAISGLSNSFSVASAPSTITIGTLPTSMNWNCAQTINWTSTPGTGNVSIELTDAAGTSVSTLADGIANTGSFNWTVGKDKTGGYIAGVAGELTDSKCTELVPPGRVRSVQPALPFLALRFRNQRHRLIRLVNPFRLRGRPTRFALRPSPLNTRTKVS